MGLSTKQTFISLAIWLIGIFALAAIAGFGSITAPEVYASFLLPSWAPPGSIFGPVWGVLYLMIAVSGWLVWRDRDIRQTKTTFALFIAQMVANVLWSWFFFAWQSGFLAFLNILVLVFLLIATMTALWRLKATLATLLLVPYLCWVCFATYLNFSVWQLNPTLL